MGVSPDSLDDDDDGHHHRDVSGGGLRAAVFGLSDGLVTNISLILGVAGAHPGGGFVRLAGVAGLVAGAFSMGAGEFVSMRAQGELMMRELDIERTALRLWPKDEGEELVTIYVRRGISRSVAEHLAEEIMRDPDLALETHAREELGFDPRAIGSPIQAALSSFLAFSLGAVLPLIPWLIGSGSVAVIASVVIAALTATIVGGALGVLTGRPIWRAALRQLIAASAAAAITYGIGRGVG
ncbi:MAG: VIT1/CCC1 transporter family protein, partial [Acidimicrobiales bacterium]